MKVVGIALAALVAIACVGCSSEAAPVSEGKAMSNQEMQDRGIVSEGQAPNSGGAAAEGGAAAGNAPPASAGQASGDL